MSDVDAMEVTAREQTTTGGVKTLRRSGMVPGIIYGNNREPAMVAIDRRAVVKELNRGGFMGRVYELDMNGRKQRCLPRDVQLHPVTDVPLHVDFLRLADDAKIAVMVPVLFINEEESVGLERGGVLNIVRHEVELLCPNDNIPENIQIDLTGTDIGDSLKISDVKLPGDVEVTITDRDFTIATITGSSAVVEEAAEEAAEAEAEAAADDETDGDGGDGEAKSED
ncbi:MAG: 50S ribosomal protein L25/general stress protein Ctc [Minwuia sp.]|nr:50S ribosomal protein L25/general stress protein Ctc [Minwuia sp.]